ncbi:hypothetical protein AALP_AA6G247700 [Arabis alpina]|uniref:Uncharacterized protein n=1 Tax=Arabis alpina TaxID=50452 RepID=A0A087GRH6_ARAAL|nr:hypothetical protein AALP_AA6G247700 [Arabis alpina]
MFGVVTKERVASDRVEAGTGRNRLRDFFPSVSTSIGGAVLSITENEQMVSRIIAETVKGKTRGGSKTFTATLRARSKAVEEDGRIRYYMASQPEINENMRSIGL